MALPMESITVGPSPRAFEAIGPNGPMKVPEGWALLPPGDAALTRRVKAGGAHWVVKEKKGRRMFSRGVWAPAERIETLRAVLETERADPAYQKKLDAGRKRRALEQEVYAEDFESAVFTYLAFTPKHIHLGQEMAKAIAAHAVPVGSGTVARTKRIPIERRAEAATIAWMRHQTTAYDTMTIPRVKGMRREVRRMLAKRSKDLLGRYRRGESTDESCPLYKALSS
ncbi:MAG: hypothetical protein ACI9KE_003131 [Polyangiales bacterium]|jgi:hypothetical protein